MPNQRAFKIAHPPFSLSFRDSNQLIFNLETRRSIYKGSLWLNQLSALTF